MTPHAPSAPNTLIPGTSVDTIGTYAYSDAKVSSKLNLSGSGTAIHWIFEISRPLPGGGSSGGSSAGAMSLTTAGDPWFVHAESPVRMWFFDGTRTLSYSLNDEHGGHGGQAIFEGKLQHSDHKVPDEVIRKLPGELQKLFPTLPPAGPRPSI